MKEYYVYIATSRNRVLYTGITSDLRRRHSEHHSGQSRFTAKYRVDRIVYYEVFSDVRLAIEREKQIKGWRRSKKIALIEKANPNWIDGDTPWLP